jgi:hypothetical protein
MLCRARGQSHFDRLAFFVEQCLKRDRGAIPAAFRPSLAVTVALLKEAAAGRFLIRF